MLIFLDFNSIFVIHLSELWKLLSIKKTGRNDRLPLKVFRLKIISKKMYVKIMCYLYTYYTSTFINLP